MSALYPINKNLKNVVFDKLTPSDIRRFWKIYTSRYSTKVINKRSSGLMKLGGYLLSKQGSCTKKDFLNNIVTTIGHNIYCPFDIGFNHPLYSLVEQIFLCIHEHYHVENDVGVSYLLSKNARAKEETKVYTGTNLLHYIIVYGYIQSIDYFANICAFSSKLYQTSKYDQNYTKQYARTIGTLYRQTGMINSKYIADASNILVEMFI